MASKPIILDSQTLRFEDEFFDVVRTERMLMHVSDADRAFAEMSRSDGSRIIVSTIEGRTEVLDH